MDPSMENSYWVPDLHNFDSNMAGELRIKKEADRLYKCKGTYLYIHYCEGGLPPRRHVRVGYLL